MVKDEIYSHPVLSILSKSVRLTMATTRKQELMKITSMENNNSHKIHTYSPEYSYFIFEGL